MRAGQTQGSEAEKGGGWEVKREAGALGAAESGEVRMAAESGEVRISIGAGRELRREAMSKGDDRYVEEGGRVGQLRLQKIEQRGEHQDGDPITSGMA